MQRQLNSVWKKRWCMIRLKLLVVKAAALEEDRQRAGLRPGLVYALPPE